jgi:hypothetical protein
MELLWAALIPLAAPAGVALAAALAFLYKRL